jgi:hypothetical protein
MTNPANIGKTRGGSCVDQLERAPFSLDADQQNLLTGWGSAPVSEGAQPAAAEVRRGRGVTRVGRKLHRDCRQNLGRAIWSVKEFHRLPAGDCRSRFLCRPSFPGLRKLRHRQKSMAAMDGSTVNLP